MSIHILLNIIKYYIALLKLEMFASNADYGLYDSAVDLMIEIVDREVGAKCFLVDHYVNHNHNRGRAEEVYSSIDIYIYNESDDEVVKRMIFYCTTLLYGWDHYKITALTGLLHSPVLRYEKYRKMIAMTGLYYCQRLLTAPEASWLSKTVMSYNMHEFIAIINKWKNSASSMREDNLYSADEKLYISHILNLTRLYLGISLTVAVLPIAGLSWYAIKKIYYK